jgi:hypothetical protein
MKGRSGGSRAALVAGLIVLVGLAAVAAVKSIPPGSAQALPSVSSTPDTSRQRRPFEHRQHERVSCVSCHGTGEQHRTFLVQTPRDCASCHHDPARAQTCGTCHSAGLPNNQPIPTSLRLSVWDSARSRVLRFSHDIHTAINCRDCHTTPVTMTRVRDCASCHTEHHRPEANCTTCHVSAKAGVHRASVHLSCAGSGCHSAAVAPPPTLSRTLCLACHEKQTTHEPGRVCADCHRIPRSAPHNDIGLREAVQR